MPLVTVTARQRKVKTDQMGHVVDPLTDITFEGPEIDVNPAGVLTVKKAGESAPDSSYHLVTLIGGPTFYVDDADKGVLSA